MVPNLIHQIIIGSKTNEAIEYCLNSWQVLQNTGFEIKHWDNALINHFLKNHYPFALEAYSNARNYGEASDIARYLVIHHYGGYYADWDVQLIHPTKFIDLCMDTPSGFLIEDPFNNTLASECFSAVTGEPYLLSLTKDIVELYSKGFQTKLQTPQYSGPYRMRDSLKRHNNSRQKLVDINAIFAYNYREIREMPEKDISQPLIHYWLHTWVGKNSSDDSSVTA